MIKHQVALLGAVATLGILGGGFVSPAQAISIKYNVSGTFLGAGNLTGSFDYDSTTSTYQNIDLTSNSLIGTTNYTSANSTLLTETSTGFTLDLLQKFFNG
jgi:hypothetical protein